MKVSFPLAKETLIPLGLVVAPWAIDLGIQKKILDSGTTTLIVSNKEMNDTIKIAKALEDSGMSLKENKIAKIWICRSFIGQFKC